MSIERLKLYLRNIKYFYYLYIFLSLLVLTYFPYMVVQKKFFSNSLTFLVIILSTIIQIICHLKFFFHLEYFQDYYWSVIISFFSLLIIFIIISGSIWIMNDLY